MWVYRSSASSAFISFSVKPKMCCCSCLADVCYLLITPCCIRACMTSCHVASELLLRCKRMKVSVCVCRCMASCIYYRVEPLASTVWPYTSVQYFILNVPSTMCSSCAAMAMAVRQTFKWNHPDPTTRVCLFTRSESGYWVIPTLPLVTKKIISFNFFVCRYSFPISDVSFSQPLCVYTQCHTFGRCAALLSDCPGRQTCLGHEECAVVASYNLSGWAQM